MADQTELLASALPEYRSGPIPDDVRTVARSSVLDWLGVTIAAASSEPVRGLRSVLRPEAAPGGSTLVGGGRTTPLLAARLNGTAGHVLDFDDVLASFGHPTVPVLPVALALAEDTGSTGDALLRAFIGGIETEARVSDLVGARHYEAGFHSTATLGVFGAAAAAAMLLELDGSETQTALGLASLSSAGLKAAFGSWGKSLQVGHAAAEGLLAALLARAGATGPQPGLGGTQGYLSTHRVTPDPTVREEVDAPGRPWRTTDMLFKYHASCYGTHSSIESLLALRTEAHGADVREIRLGVSPRHIGMCDQTDARTELQGKFSLAFTSALAWLRGSAGEADFRPESLADTAVQDLATRVRVIEDAERDFSTTDVTVQLADGRTLRSAVNMAIPAPAGELAAQWNRLETKFRRLTAPLLPSGVVDRLVAAVAGIDRSPTLTGLTAALAAAGDALHAPTTVTR
ncbi:MmgE/PrpD family protein [Cumulibacter manganitolerans]|uniref:MmgE/PrpD family protein n=1 Tax=Cumulibacter manganitolerans TaxID=1884992 RepID=UPI001296948E|nr:MmgE/PrpD family protein [Cumulibacter manganitolerans]